MDKLFIQEESRGCLNLFRKVWVCACVCFVMCGYFGNMCTCTYCVLYCLFCVTVLCLLCILYSYCFVYTSVETAATGEISIEISK